MGEQHEFVVFGYATVPVRMHVMAPTQAEAKAKAKASKGGWTLDEQPSGVHVSVLSVLPPEGFNGAAMRRVGIDVPERPSKKPVFMIPTEGKTAEELAEETFEAVQAHWRATGKIPSIEQDP